MRPSKTPVSAWNRFQFIFSNEGDVLHRFGKALALYRFSHLVLNVFPPGNQSGAAMLMQVPAKVLDFNTVYHAVVE